jgi:hypothetical protein
MAVKTFTTGEVLTASDTNTYLNNGGLVYVSSGSFTNAATADITGFTTTYLTFRVVINVVRQTGSGTAAVTATLRDSTTGMATGYYGASYTLDYLGGAGVTAARNNGINMGLGSVVNQTSRSQMIIDISNMNQNSVNTCYTGVIYDGSQAGPTMVGYESSAKTVAPDRIRLACAQNITGNWRVYGYREP